jgi:hypothetical protein
LGCADDKCGGVPATADRYAGEKKYVVCVIIIIHSRTLSFRRVGDVLDVNCLAERPGIATVLAVRPFRCVGGDPVGVAFTSYGCSSIVEPQQGKYIFSISIICEKNACKETTK